MRPASSGSPLAQSTWAMISSPRFESRCKLLSAEPRCLRARGCRGCRDILILVLGRVAALSIMVASSRTCGTFARIPGRCTRRAYDDQVARKKVDVHDGEAVVQVWIFFDTGILGICRPPVDGPGRERSPRRLPRFRRLEAGVSTSRRCGLSYLSASSRRRFSIPRNGVFSHFAVHVDEPLAGPFVDYPIGCAMNHVGRTRDHGLGGVCSRC